MMGRLQIRVSWACRDFFPSLFILVVHYTYQHMPCLVAVVGRTHVHHIVTTHINTCQVLLLLLAGPMYTTLFTTYQHMPCLVAVVGRTHVHHVAHYTSTHVLLMLLAGPMYTTLFTTHQHMPCLVAVVGRTHVHHVVYYTSTHAMSCCWQDPCTPRCLLHINTCHVLLLLLAGPMYTTLLTTHQHMPCLVAVVGRTHVHHVAHYTSTHAMSCCCCWQDPCTPRCLLHINTCHVLLLLLAGPMYTTLFTTHINTCHVLLLLLAGPMYTTLFTTHQHMPCLVAVVGRTHVHHVAHYTSTHAMSCCCCWQDPCTPRCLLHINTCHVLLLLLAGPMYTTLFTTHINTCHVLLLLLAGPMYTTLFTTHQHMPCLFAVVGRTHVHHLVHYTYISTYHILLLLLTVPI